MGLRFVMLISISTALIASLQAAGPTAEVELRLTTTNGDSFDTGFAVELIDVATREKLNVTFQGVRAKAVPYGEYILRVEVPGFKKFEERLLVFQSHVYARIGLSLSEIVDHEPRRISGILRSVPNHQDIWLRLVPIPANGTSMDALVGSDGSFSFSGMHYGRYVVMVLNGTKLLLTKQIEPSTRNVDIAIP